MSYDISLYQSEFLQRAVAESLGDWRGAPAIDEVVLNEIQVEASRLGLQGVVQDPGFVAFAAAQGHAVATEFVLDNDEFLFQLMVFKNSVTFSIPYSNRATKSIARCLELARAWAVMHSLGLYDPQGGELGG